MKNLILFFALVLVTERATGQDPLTQPAVKPHQFFVHYYPSDLIAGDITFGLEHLYKKRLSHELSFGIKSLPTTVYYYTNGYRLDYFLKYNIYSGKIFRFSSNLSFTYKDIYYTNRTTGHLYMDETGKISSEPYATYLEDRRLKEFGLGLGFSLNFRLSKKLFAGADITLNSVRSEYSYHEKEQIGGVIYQRPYSQNLLYTTTDNSIMNIAPYARLKISYALGRQ